MMASSGTAATMSGVSSLGSSFAKSMLLRADEHSTLISPMLIVSSPPRSCLSRAFATERFRYLSPKNAIRSAASPSLSMPGPKLMSRGSIFSMGTFTISLRHVRSLSSSSGSM